MNKYSAKCQLSVVAMVSIQSKIHDCMGERMQLDYWGELVTGVARQQNKIPRLE
jgi:hypothetical protein